MSSASQGKPQKGKRRLLVQAEVGSTVWGLNLVGECDCKMLEFKGVQAHFDACATRRPKSDRDEMGVVIEGLPEVVGFSPFEQEVYRTATARTGKHDAPSQPGDLDLTTYSLRKWMRLALKGNPTILTLLFVPRKLWTDGDGLWEHIQFLAPRIVSKQAGKAFLGYLQAQRMRMLGERGGLDVHRKELEEKYGYDTKYAMHMLRLGFQGTELLRTGSMAMPMQEDDRNFLLGVRKGESSRQVVLTRCGELESELKDLLETSPLPNSPDFDYMEKYVNYLYWTTWVGKYGSLDYSLTEDMDFTPPEAASDLHTYVTKVRNG